MARPGRERTTSPRGATLAQLREAERGLRFLLAPTFSAAWIAQNVGDLLNEANAEYAEWLRDHQPARNPPGWLVQRGRWRAIDLIRRETRQAGPPLDSVVHVIEDPGPTPEDTLIERDRQRRIAEALSHIPEKEQKLLALVYSEGYSITAAGRLVGWGKANASEHHTAATNKLHALLGERDLLSPGFVGLLAQVLALGGDRGRVAARMAKRISAMAQDLVDLVARTLSSATRAAGDTARRAVPLAETGTAVASGGPGRLIAQCGAIAAAVLCSAALIAPIEHDIGTASPPRSGRSGDRVDNPRSSSIETSRSEPPQQPSDRAPAGSPRSAATAKPASRRKERKTNRNAHARLGQSRPAPKGRRHGKANGNRTEREGPSLVVEEPAATPLPEVVVPEAESASAPQSSPPPATGSQTRQEFGL
jgi:RNA polymerase sigma factor (sigma-70 family)